MRTLGASRQDSVHAQEPRDPRGTPDSKSPRTLARLRPRCERGPGAPEGEDLIQPSDLGKNRARTANPRKSYRLRVGSVSDLGPKCRTTLAIARVERLVQLQRPDPHPQSRLVVVALQTKGVFS